MSNRIRRRARGLLWLHLFVCVVWLSLFRTEHQPAGWMLQVFFWSILGVQFTWGYTVGLIVGPARKRRPLLWWSLLTVFMPLYFTSWICYVIAHFSLWWAAVYFCTFAMILCCETYCGVLLGAKAHSEMRD